MDGFVDLEGWLKRTRLAYGRWKEFVDELRPYQAETAGVGPYSRTEMQPAILA
jgi:hypothetical protein